jgi:18S rRNA (guanine1575-N7)-methyltransferase
MFRGKKRDRRGNEQLVTKSKEWILAKKERQRRQGKDVREDSKFSGRKRRNKGGF